MAIQGARAERGGATSRGAQRGRAGRLADAGGRAGTRRRGVPRVRQHRDERARGGAWAGSGCRLARRSASVLGPGRRSLWRPRAAAARVGAGRGVGGGLRCPRPRASAHRGTGDRRWTEPPARRSPARPEQRRLGGALGGGSARRHPPPRASSSRASLGPPLRSGPGRGDARWGGPGRPRLARCRRVEAGPRTEPCRRLPARWGGPPSRGRSLPQSPAEGPEPVPPGRKAVAWGRRDTGRRHRHGGARGPRRWAGGCRAPGTVRRGSARRSRPPSR